MSDMYHVLIVRSSEPVIDRRRVQYDENNQHICTAQNKRSSDALVQARKRVMLQVPGKRFSDETRSSAGREFQTTGLETAKALAPSTVLVLRGTSFRASSNFRRRLLATDETGTESSSRCAGANALRHCTRSSLT